MVQQRRGLSPIIKTAAVRQQTVAYHSKFISVIDRQHDDDNSSPGTISITFSEVCKNPQSFTVELTLVEDEDEIDVATALRDAINDAAIAAGFDYSGVPWFPQIDTKAPFFLSSSSSIPFSFLATSCEHVVNIWSQKNFRIKVNDEGGTILGVGNPSYLTINAADEIYNTLLSNSKWPGFSRENKRTALLNASGALMSLAGGFPLIQSQFMSEVRANFTNGFHLGVYPIVEYDGFYTASAVSLLDMTILPLSTVINYMVERDGNVTFQNLSLMLWKDNIIKMHFEAGLDSIPEVLMVETLKVLKDMRTPDRIDTLKAGTSMLKVKDMDKYQAALVARLKGLFEV